MEISRDVTFDEDATLKRSKNCQHEEVYEEYAPPRNVEATFLPEDHDMTQPQEPPTMEISRKRKPAWAREIIQEAERYGAPEGSTRISKKPKPFSNYVADSGGSKKANFQNHHIATKIVPFRRAHEI